MAPPVVRPEGAGGEGVATRTRGVAFAAIREAGLHRGGVGHEDLTVVSVGFIGSGEPVELLQVVLRAHASHGHPLSRRGELAGVEPGEALGQPKAEFIDEPAEEAFLVNRHRRPAGFPDVAEVEDDAAVRGELLRPVLGKAEEPVDVLLGRAVAVFFLADEGIGG